MTTCNLCQGVHRCEDCHGDIRYNGTNISYCHCDGGTRRHYFYPVWGPSKEFAGAVEASSPCVVYPVGRSIPEKRRWWEFWK